MNARCRQENRAAEQLKTPISVHPLKSHCALLSSCAWGENFGVINMTFPPADTCSLFLWICSDILRLLPARGRQVSCGDALFTQTCKTKLSARIWALFPLQTRQGFLVYCSTLYTKSLPHARHTSPEFCRPLEERIHFLSHLWPLLRAVFSSHIRDWPMAAHSSLCKA